MSNRWRTAGLAAIVLVSSAMIGLAAIPAAASDRVVADMTLRDAVPLTFPSAATTASSSTATAIDCPADGECVAGGRVTSPTDPTSDVPFIVVQRGGVWGTAQVLAFPAGAIPAGPSEIAVFDIDCVAVGSCEVTGVVSSGASEVVAWRVRVSNGIASVPQMLTFAAPAPYSVVSIYPNGLDCVAVDTCLIVGEAELVDGQSDRRYVPLQWTVASGTASGGTVIPLPAAVLDPVAQYLASASDVSCPAAGECVVTGSSLRSTSDPVTWVRIQRAGVWGDASVVGPPAGLEVIDPNHAINARSAVECWSIGECMVMGSFQSAARHRGLAPFVASISAGVPQQGQALTLPATFVGDDDVYGSDLVCGGPGSCLAVAEWDGAVGSSSIARFESTGGVWGAGVTLPTIDGVTIAFPAAIACRAVGQCVIPVVTSSGSYVVVESAGTWNSPVSLNPVTGIRPALYSDVFDVACVRGGQTCTLAGDAADESLFVTSTGIASVDGRGVGRNRERSLGVSAGGAAPQATTPPWAVVQTLDWTPPPTPEPEPATPKYTG